VEEKAMSFFNLLAQLNQRKTIREIQSLMKQLEDAVNKEKHENKSNENQATDGSYDTAVHRATDYA